MGSRGQFTIALDGNPVIEKRALSFPEDGEIVDALRKALGRSS